MEMKDIQIIRALLEKLTSDELRELHSQIGNKLVATDRVETTIEQDSFELGDTQIAIEFCESTAANFARALTLARLCPLFGERSSGKKKWYLAAWPTEDFLAAMPIVQALSGLRNKRCYYQGKEADWSQLFAFSDCASERVKAYRPSLYCFGSGGYNGLNPWGCINTRLDWSDWAQWLTYGKFEKSGLLGRGVIWKFDKARIRHELEQNLFRYRYCPHLRLNLIDAVMNELPETVDIVTGCGWKYRRCSDNSPGSIAVRETRDEAGYKYTDEYYSDGIAPDGPRVLQEILLYAYRKTGATDVDVKQLMK